MARSIQDIQQEIYQSKENEPALNELNSTSKTAIWRLMIYIVSVAIWTLEKIFDLHKKEVDEMLAIPMVGHVQSLNAGVAAGLLMYEVFRKRN